MAGENASRIPRSPITTMCDGADWRQVIQLLSNPSFSHRCRWPSERNHSRTRWPGSTLTISKPNSFSHRNRARGLEMTTKSNFTALGSALSNFDLFAIAKRIVDTEALIPKLCADTRTEAVG